MSENRRRVPLASLAALAVALALEALDFRSGFVLLELWHCAALLALACLLLIDFRSSTIVPAAFRRLLLACGTMVLLGASLLVVHHAWSRHVAATWEKGRESRLSDRAGRIRGEFADLLETLSSPARSLAGIPPENRPELFEMLERTARQPRAEAERYGWTLWRQDNASAWAGRTAIAAALPEGASRQGATIVAQGASLILAAATPLEGGATLVGEYLLQSPLEETPRLPLLHRPELGGAVVLRVAAPGRRDDAGDLSSIRMGRSRHGARPGSANLFVPLQDSSGRTLIVVSLTERTAEEVVQELRRRHRIAGLLLAAGGFLVLSQICFRRRPLEGSGRWFMAGAGFLAAARASLLPMSGGPSAPEFFDSRLFGSLLAEPLFRSPADFFLTALAFILMTAELQRARWGSRILPRPALLAAGVLLLAPSGYFLARLASETPLHARFDVARVEFFPPYWPRILIQAGLLLLFGAWLLLLLRWGDAMRRAFARTSSWARPRLPAAGRALAFVSLTVLLVLPLILRSSLRQKESFYRDTLLPEVESQSAIREQILKEVIEQLDRSRRAKRILLSSGRGGGEGTAYRLWSLTRLREEGLSSSLRLFSPDGTMLGRFGLNLPAELAGQELTPRDPDHPRRLLVRVGGLRRRVLVAETLLKARGTPPHRVQVYLVDETENLSLIRAGNPYSEVFQIAQTRETNPELIGSEPLFASLDPAGRLQESNLEGGPVLAPDFLSSLPQEQPRWTEARVGEERFRVVAKRSSQRILVMGFRLPTGLRVTGSFIRLILMGMVLGGGLAVALGLLGGGGFPRLFPRPGLFRRLLAVFLAASCLPLFALAFFLNRFAAREFEENLLSQGIASLGAASRIIEDYVFAEPQSEPSPLIEDGIAYWIARVVNQDISLYREGILSATSTRELFASGLLPMRLDAPVYRRLYLEGRPYALTRQRVGSLSPLVITAPLSLGNPAAGALSLPLSIQEREIRDRRADVDEAILIVTVVMLVLLTLLSDLVARRVSRPISALAAASGRIESGDFDAEVRVRARDEPAMLIDSFNRMAASLRRQREDLRRRSDYIGKILLHATTGVVSTDSEERVVTVNPAAQLLLGLASPPAAGSHLLEALSAHAALTPLRQALAGSPPDRETRWQLELPWEDRPTTLRVASLPFREDPASPPGRILLLEDLTETVRSSRLQAWAEMARTIAHEIKNPLTPIQLSADHLRKVYSASDPGFGRILEECLQTIQKQVRALRGIAADFSNYARIPDFKPERVAPSTLLEEVLAPYRETPPPGLRVELTIDPATPDLWVDPVLTRRALANLVQNALEAMPEGGTLSVLAGASPDGRGARRLPEVRVRVRDTGPGMDAATRSRLFEPYFSTKASGTGLGLSIVRKTTEEQGGRVQILSAPGKGTEVLLDLPAWDPGRQTAPASAPGAPIR